MPDTLIAPAYLWVPERVGSYGDEAVDLARLAGRELDAAQCLAVDALLSYGPGGRWLALESAVIEARQNGKTGGVLLPVVLFDLFLLGADRIVWTAHLFRTARDAFADFTAMIDATPELSRRVKKVTYANGEEAIELHSGALLEFLARSKGGGRGLGGKRLVMDEALFLAAESMGALIPTLSAREDPQINYGSSAGMAGSDHLRRLRDRGRGGGDRSLIWVEWCARGGWDDPPCAAGLECLHVVGSEGCALDDESLWPAANPALGRRITYAYVRAERRALPPEEFGRERLGWFDLAEGDDPPVIGAAAWQACSDPESAPLDPVAFFIEVAWDRGSAAIAAAGIRADGLLHVEIVDVHPGTAWVPERAAALKEKWRPYAFGLDPVSPAGSLTEDLQKAGVEPELANAGDLKRGCGSFYDGVIGKGAGGTRVRHLGDPQLAAAVLAGRRRSMGDAWVWDRKASPDALLLMAVTMAMHTHSVHSGTGDALDNIW